MTSSTEPQDIRPDAADPVGEALAQLADPRQLLAEALVNIRSAQMISADIVTNPAPEGDDFDTPRGGRHRRLLDEAFHLSRTAEIAARIAMDERTVAPVLTDADLDGLAPGPADEWTPKPSQARFVAAVDGIPMGTIGRYMWLWSEDFGFVNVAFADTVAGLKSGGVRATFSGTLKTVTGSQVIGVTEGGTAVLLPRVCVIESPDE